MYNELRSVEDSYKILKNSKFDISSLGALFVKSGVHEYLGICLLHKHYDILPGETVVQKGLITSPDTVDIKDLFPIIMKVNKDSLEYLEFTHDKGANKYIPIEFYKELNRILSDNGLDDVLGITVINGKDKYYLEHTEDRNNILERISKEQAHELGSNIPTNWFFNNQPTDACVSSTRCETTISCSVVCRSTPNRGHSSSTHAQSNTGHRSITMPHQKA